MIASTPATPSEIGPANMTPSITNANGNNKTRKNNKINKKKTAQLSPSVRSPKSLDFDTFVQPYLLYHYQVSYASRKILTILRFMQIPILGIA